MTCTYLVLCEFALDMCLFANHNTQPCTSNPPNPGDLIIQSNPYTTLIFISLGLNSLTLYVTRTQMNSNNEGTVEKSKKKKMMFFAGGKFFREVILYN